MSFGKEWNNIKQDRILSFYSFISCLLLIALIAFMLFTPQFSSLPAHATPLQTTTEPSISLTPNVSTIDLGSMDPFSGQKYEQYGTWTTMTNSPLLATLFISP